MRQRVLHGLGANVFGQLVTIIVQLAGVPILLHAWGTQLYGEWLILFAIPAYLSMTDMGFTQSAANDMTARVARDDRGGALVMFQSLSMLVIGLTAFGLVLSTIAVPLLPLTSWLNFQALDAPTARWVLWLLAAQVLMGLVDGIPYAGFRANGEYALHSWIHSVVRLIQSAGVWGTALIGGGPLMAAAVSFTVRAVAAVAVSLWVVRRHPWLRYGRSSASAAELRRLLSPALANMAVPLAQALNIQGMVIVVGAALGPVAVVTFSTLRTLTRLAMQLVTTVAHAVEPELASAHGSRNRELMRGLFIHALRGGLWLALLAAVALALCGSRVLELWTHGRVAMHGALFAWLLASAVASVLWYGSLSVLKAANQHLHAAMVYVMASAAAIGLAAALLSQTNNLAYAGAALLVMDAAMTAYTLAAAGTLLGMRPLTSLAQAANPLPFLENLRGRVRER